VYCSTVRVCCWFEFCGRLARSDDFVGSGPTFNTEYLPVWTSGSCVGFAVCGLWFAVCGLWFAVCGLLLAAIGSRVGSWILVRDG
jgi:hypothetical protein